MGADRPGQCSASAVGQFRVSANTCGRSLASKARWEAGRPGGAHRVTRPPWAARRHACPDCSSLRVVPHKTTTVRNWARSVRRADRRARRANGTGDFVTRQDARTKTAMFVPARQAIDRAVGGGGHDGDDITKHSTWRRARPGDTRINPRVAPTGDRGHDGSSQATRGSASPTGDRVFPLWQTVRQRSVLPGVLDGDGGEGRKV